ncbi:hypothetical protein B6U91_01725 [Candidatus Pacearchaeota archaeon ex4484_71]|nr:MAG: hypothetical protein B6U91_01725 [Candidatus Pacearchaeota archaeon ex4484_71]
MLEVILLIVLGLAWLLLATVQDLKKTEIYNWGSFSLIIFAIAIRFFYGVFSEDFRLLYQGLLWFGIFFLFSNFLYYLRFFAGGDQKLLMALGAILPLYGDFSSNLKISIIFVGVFFFTGLIYTLLWVGAIGFKNFSKLKKELRKQFKKYRKHLIFMVLLSTIFLIAGFYESIFFWIGVFVFGISYLILYVVSVDESCMVGDELTASLEEGDLLYKKVKINGVEINPSWAGLSKRQIRLLKKNRKKVKIRRGIPYVPVFLISFLIFVFFFFTGVFDNIFSFLF